MEIWSCKSFNGIVMNSPAFTAPAFDTMRPISRSRVASLIYRVLFAEIHLNGPELHRELPLDAVPKLPEQINSPGSYHDIEAIGRELPGQLFPDPRRRPRH